LAWCVNRASCVSFKAYRPTRPRERQLTRRSEENEASVCTGEWGKEWAWVNGRTKARFFSVWLQVLVKADAATRARCSGTTQLIRSSLNNACEGARVRGMGACRTRVGK